MRPVIFLQLADVIVRRREGEEAESFRSLADCLFHYFNLPHGIFQAEVQTFLKIVLPSIPINTVTLSNLPMVYKCVKAEGIIITKHCNK